MLSVLVSHYHDTLGIAALRIDHIFVDRKVRGKSGGGGGVVVVVLFERWLRQQIVQTPYLVI